MILCVFSRLGTWEYFVIKVMPLYFTQTSSKTINKLANPNAPLGYGLCFLNLVFDGFTNATQDSISARYSVNKLRISSIKTKGG